MCKADEEEEEKEAREGQAVCSGPHIHLHEKPSLGASCPPRTAGALLQGIIAVTRADAGSLEPSPDLVAIVILLSFVGH